MTTLDTHIRQRPAAVIVAQGKLLDFVDGHTQRPETPEEYVRQEIAKSLVREYGYPKADIRDHPSTSTHIGPWSLVFSQPLGVRSTPAALSLLASASGSLVGP